MTTLTVAEQRARDALAFDPLPPSPWVTADDHGIVIAVRYSEVLSGLLRSISGARWLSENRHWRYPFRSRDAIALALDRINDLAGAAKERADRENKRRREKNEQIAAELAHRKSKQRAEFKPRVMRAEFMVQSGPHIDLSLESVGDDTYQLLRSDGWPRPCWVAQIIGHDGRKWLRAFLPGRRDYERANSKGSRGIMVHFAINEGPVYEVSSHLSWREVNRYFARVSNGLIVRMMESEVLMCLEK